MKTLVTGGAGLIGSNNVCDVVQVGKLAYIPPGVGRLQHHQRHTDTISDLVDTLKEVSRNWPQVHYGDPVRETCGTV